MTKIITLAAAPSLAGCGLADMGVGKQRYQAQLEADHQACINGTTPNACLAYKLAWRSAAR